MAITLRDTTPNNTGKGSELTYLDMDTNLESFYYSSSLSGGNLSLFTTGSTTHTISLAGAAGAQGAPGTNGAQGAPGAASNVPGPEGAQGADGPAGAQGADGTPGIDGAQGAPGADSSVAGPQGAQGAPGGGGTPGGSNTHVQFNQLGAFGGDAGLTYVSASQILTVDKSTAISAASPNIKLLGNTSTVGSLAGVIAASATLQNPAPASIKFRNAPTTGLGDFSTDVILSTAIFDGASSTVERTALTLSASGDAYFDYDVYAPGLDNTFQTNFVGLNTSTGKLTYFSTGSFRINTGSLQNPSISRDAPTGVSSVIFDVDIATSDANWTIEAVNTGGTPSGVGKARINNSGPTSVTQFSVWKTANSSVNMSSQLEQLAPGSIITLTAVGANTATGTYRIIAKSLITNAVTYTVSYIEGAAFTFAIGATFTIDTVEGVFEYTLARGYNYLNVRNNGNLLNRLRLRYEAETSTYPDGGGYIPIQILCNGSGNGFSIDYIADLKGYSFADGNGTTGTWSSTDPVIGFITNDFKPGDRFISSFLVWGEGNNEGIVPQHWTVYQSDTALEPSHRTVPTQWYQNTFNSDERITTTTIPNLYELNGGTINIDPQGGTNDRLILGLGGLLTDYSVAINNVNGANLVQLNIVTPAAKNGWEIIWIGYRTSTTERYRAVNVGINGGAGINSPVKLDWSGRAEVSVDYNEGKIIVWSSNWEN